jgi:hypothetical protein
LNWWTKASKTPNGEYVVKSQFVSTANPILGWSVDCDGGKHGETHLTDAGRESAKDNGQVAAPAPTDTPQQNSVGQDDSFCDQLRGPDAKIRCHVDCKKEQLTCNQWRAQLDTQTGK